MAYSEKGRLKTGFISVDEELELTPSEFKTQADVDEEFVRENDRLRLDDQRVMYDWEDSNPLDAWGGDAGDAAVTVQSSTVLEGSQSLEMALSGNYKSIASTSGLPFYPGDSDVGGTWRYRFSSNLLGSASVNTTYVELGWHVDSETVFPDGYLVQARSVNRLVAGKRTGGGGPDVLESAEVEWKDNTKYELQVTEIDQESTSRYILELYEDVSGDGLYWKRLFSISFEDGEFNDEKGVSLSGNSDSGQSHNVYHDYGRGGRYGDSWVKDTWARFRSYYDSNPVIAPSDNPDANNEQYAVTIVELPSGGYAIYAKSDEISTSETVLRLWESTDGKSWTRQSTTIHPNDLNVSDASSVRVPHLMYVPVENLYYLWVRANRDNNPEDVRLFTGASHDNLSLESNSPKVEASDITWESATGVWLQDTVEHQGTKYAYGTYRTSSGPRLWYGTFDGDSWTSSITPQAELCSDALDYENGDVLHGGGVFQRPDGYWVFIFASGTSGSNGEFGRQTYYAVGEDPTDFTPQENVFVGCNINSWRSRWAYAGDFVKINGEGHRRLKEFDDGRYRFYMNGQPIDDDGGSNGSIGLVYYSGFPGVTP